MSNTVRLEVIIIGSGLAGLAAAGILREHHNVTVYERGNVRIATGGQGISISPGTVKILDSIGYDRNLCGAVPHHGMQMYNKEGTLLEDVPLDLKAQFGEHMLCQKRADFRDELLRLATAQPESAIRGEPAKILFNTAVTGIDPDEGRITLSDGLQATADVLIVADGIHSNLRRIVLNSDAHNPQKTGLTVYRVEVPVQKANEALCDLPIPQWWKTATTGDTVSMNLMRDVGARVIAMYCMRSWTYVNFSLLIRTTDSTRDTTESWHAEGNLQSALTLFDDYPEALCRILSVASEVREWELQEVRDIPTWTRGRAMLIGDAAHAMTPIQGNGANMAIEDAESFRLLGPGTRREDVPTVLKLAGIIRKQRVSQISDENRNAGAQFSSLAERMGKNKDLYYGYKGIHHAVKVFQENAET